jgi:hypothetical protein
MLLTSLRVDVNVQNQRFKETHIEMETDGKGEKRN